MKYPKIREVTVIDSHTLLLEFNNNEKKTYDVSPLFEKKMFSPLKDIAVFKNVTIEQGGFAVSWNNEIDISEYELWKNGKPL